MSYNIIASFSQPRDAQQARNALLTRGLSEEDLRLTEHDMQPQADHGDYDTLSSLLDCGALGLGLAGLGVICTVFNPDLRPAAIAWGLTSIVLGGTVGWIRGRAKMQQYAHHNGGSPTATLRVKLGDSLSQQDAQAMLESMGAGSIVSI